MTSYDMLQLFRNKYATKTIHHSSLSIMQGVMFDTYVIGDMQIMHTKGLFDIVNTRKLSTIEIVQQTLI